MELEGGERGEGDGASGTWQCLGKSTCDQINKCSDQGNENCFQSAVSAGADMNRSWQ